MSEKCLCALSPACRFAFQIVDGGFAQAAGLMVGDVLLSVPGIFGDPTNVVGMGIEQV